MGSDRKTPSDDTFTVSVTIDRPAAEVWRALTRKADVDRYYLAPLGMDITAADRELFYGSETQRLITGRVVSFVEPIALAHTFRFSGGADAADSLITYRLEEFGGGTVLSVEHSGYTPDSQDFADISMGWPIILDGLKTYLEGRAPAGG